MSRSTAGWSPTRTTLIAPLAFAPPTGASWIDTASSWSPWVVEVLLSSPPLRVPALEFGQAAPDRRRRQLGLGIALEDLGRLGRPSPHVGRSRTEHVGDLLI